MNSFVMFRNALLVGSALGLTACGGAGTSSPVSTPPPVITPTPTPTPTPSTDVVVLDDNLTVRQNGVDYYQSGDYITYPNNWGAESFNLPTSEYSQTVEIHKNDFPNKTLISWNYPNTPYGNGSRVYGYPMIAWGKTTLALTGYNTNNSLGTIGNIDTFNVNFDVTLTGDRQYMNFMHDLFLYDPNSGKIAGEITYNIAPDDHILYWGSPDNYFGTLPGSHSHQFTANGHTYNMLVSSGANGNDNAVDGSKMIMIIPTDGSSITAGTIKWADVLKILLDDHDLSEDLIFKGTEMGVEVQAGSGSMLVNNFAVVLTMKNQQAYTQAVSQAQTTAIAGQSTVAVIGDMIDAALANPSNTTYAFTQGNIGIGTNRRITNRLSIGASNVFSPNGFTLASNVAWRRGNTYAVLLTGAGNFRTRDATTSSTFTALETGTRIPTRFAEFAPYARLGYTRYSGLDSMRLSGGMRAYVPLSDNTMLRMSGEVANEFMGRGTITGHANNMSASVPINLQGIEYSGSVNLTHRLTNNLYAQMEAGTRNTVIGTNNYVSAGMRVPF